MPANEARGYDDALTRIDFRLKDLLSILRARHRGGYARGHRPESLEWSCYGPSIQASAAFSAYFTFSTTSFSASRA